jgi:hypothetical protein
MTAKKDSSSRIVRLAAYRRDQVRLRHRFFLLGFGIGITTGILTMAICRSLLDESGLREAREVIP